MSQYNHIPPGSKRKLDSTDKSHSESYSAHSSQPLHSSQSSDECSSPRSFYEGRLSQPAGQPTLPKFHSPVSFGAGLTHVSTPLQTHSAGSTLPFPSQERSSAYTLPPLSLSPRKKSMYTQYGDATPNATQKDDSAIQNLQRSNSDLESAYSQAQSRIAELDKAVQASRMEISKLFRERQSLKAKIDVLEAEVEDLQSGTEVSQQHTAAKNAQYSQMLDLSTRLQSQAVFETQQRKVEKERWELEKHELLQTITFLRSQSRTMHTGYDKFSQSIQPRDGEERLTSEARLGDIPTTELETEVEILRHANSVMEDTMAKVRREHAQLSAYVEKLGDTGRNIQRHLQATSMGESVSDVPDGEGRGIWQGRAMDVR